MKILIALLLTLCSAIPAMADVTKEDVRKLVSAGISDNVIVQYVRTNGPVRMTVDDLAELKKLGASDTVLSALVSGRQDQRPEPQPVQTTTVVVQESPVVYYWYWGPYYYGGYYCRPYYYRPYYYRPVYRPTVVVRPTTVIRPPMRPPVVAPSHSHHR